MEGNGGSIRVASPSATPPSVAGGSRVFAGGSAYTHSGSYIHATTSLQQRRHGPTAGTAGTAAAAAAAAAATTRSPAHVRSGTAGGIGEMMLFTRMLSANGMGVPMHASRNAAAGGGSNVAGMGSSSSSSSSSTSSGGNGGSINHGGNLPMSRSRVPGQRVSPRHGRSSSSSSSLLSIHGTGGGGNTSPNTTHAAGSTTSSAPNSAVVPVPRGTCRICFEEDDITEFVSPCKCKGTQEFVHLRCLKTWQKHALMMDIMSNGKYNDRAYRCSVCNSKFTIKPRGTGLSLSSLWTPLFGILVFCGTMVIARASANATESLNAIRAGRSIGNGNASLTDVTQSSGVGGNNNGNRATRVQRAARFSAALTPPAQWATMATTVRPSAGSSPAAS